MSVGTETEHTQIEDTETGVTEDVEGGEHGEAPPAETDAHAEAHEHPSDGKYIVVAIILAILTALEVWTHFWDQPSTTLLVVTLVPMMIAKFIIVAGWFMHLRYDNPLFLWVFFAGIVIAVAVYLVAMATMHWFQPAWTQGVIPPL
jgi:cytochrome c oxidase subunit IV